VIVPVGVAYGSDVRRVEKLLLARALVHPLVINDDKKARLGVSFSVALATAHSILSCVVLLPMWINVLLR
jgi:small-conductance mechanosensitive channel